MPSIAVHLDKVTVKSQLQKSVWNPLWPSGLPAMLRIAGRRATPPEEGIFLPKADPPLAESHATGQDFYNPLLGGVRDSGG